MGPDRDLFRPMLQRPLGSALTVAMGIFVLHVTLRFVGALAHAPMLGLAMAFLWPLPWILMARAGRRSIGLRAAVSGWWYPIGAIVGAAAMAVTAGAAGLCFGGGPDNWLLLHAADMREIAVRLPPGLSSVSLFMTLAVPAMIFSPVGEEILYRGFLQASFQAAGESRTGQIVPALLFGFAHLSQFGLLPLQPRLLLLWLPSMFLVGLLFGWVRERSGSLYPAVLCHAVFNLVLLTAAWPWVG